MANVKISQLPAASTVTADVDVLPIVHSGVTEKVTPNQIVNKVLEAPGAIGGTTPNDATFTTLTAESSVFLNPVNADVELSPTGSGRTLILPEAGAIINPGVLSYMDNVAIGGTTPQAAVFTTLTSNSTTTLNGTTIPASKTLVDTDSVQTLSSKYYLNPRIWDWDQNNYYRISPLSPGLATDVYCYLPILTGNDYFSFRNFAETLTNKTISGLSNTLTDIPNSSFQYSSITLGSTSISLGGTASSITGLALTGGTVNNTAIGGTTASSGAFTTLSSTGNTTLGDASGDTLTINGTAVSIPNNLNFDSNTLFIDAANNQVGIGTSSPTAKLDVYQTGTVNGQLFLRNAGTYHTGFIGSSSATPLADSYAWGMLGGPNNYITGIANSVSLVLGTSVPNFVITRNNNLNSGPVATLLNLDSSGNLGLGVTPSGWLTGYKAFEMPQLSFLSGGGGGGLLLGNAYVNTSSQFIYKVSGQAAALYNNQGGAHQWGIAGAGTAGNPITFTTAMTLDASGNLLVGNTVAAFSTGERFSVIPISGKNGIGIAMPNANAIGIGIYCGYTATGTQTAMRFDNSVSQAVGTITCTSSTTSYNPSSDISLKENIKPIKNGLERVAKLKPVDYNWKSDGTLDNGFIAQDLLATDEFAHRCNVIDTKDDGTQIYGVDYMKFVGVLTAAIQELHARLEQLEAR